MTGHANGQRHGGQASDQANEVDQAGAGDQSDESGPWHAAHTTQRPDLPRVTIDHQHRTCSNPIQRCRNNTHRFAADRARIGRCASPAFPRRVVACRYHEADNLVMADDRPVYELPSNGARPGSPQMMAGTAGPFHAVLTKDGVEAWLGRTDLDIE